jgi:hypothetical protein
MAITLKVTGNGHFQGAETNLSGYSVREDATPIDPSISSGGTGEASFTLTEDSTSNGSILLLGDVIELEDGSNGRTAGRVSSVRGSNGIVQVTASSRLNSLVIDCTMPSFSGTLEAGFRSYLAVGDIVDGVFVDPALIGRSVVLPAWTGNLWDYLKQLCSAEQVEISLVSSNVVLRPIRQRIVETENNSAESWEVSDADLAQFVEVNYYNNEYKSAATVYPEGLGILDAPVMQVSIKEIAVLTVATNASIRSVQQPLAVDKVQQYYEGATSVYSIINSKGVPISHLEWNKYGGRVDVAIGEDLRSLIITVIGPDYITDGPFRLAGGDMDDPFSSIRIVGEAVVSTTRMLTIPTGVPAERSSQIIGYTLTNPFVSTVGQAYTAGLYIAGKYATAAQGISISATVVNRKNAPGYANYPIFSDLDALWVGKTYSEFDAANSGKTFGDITNELYALVSDNFENQAFGNISGARVPFRDAFYRINSSTVSHDIISYSGDKDTLYSDMDAVWSGATYAEFDAAMGARTYEDFAVTPLWKE